MLIFARIIVAIWTLSAIISSAQVVSNKTKIPSNYPYLDLSTPDKAHARMEIPVSEENRAGRYGNHLPPLFNESNPEKSGEIHYSTHYTYGAQDPLHIKDSTVIAVGRISAATPHLSQGGGSVYSTFQFSPGSILKGSVPNSTLTLEREGGVVMFPNGKKRFQGADNFALPVPGGTYLLFLAAPTDNSYRIIGGYSLDGSHVRSLNREGYSLSTLTAADLIAQVKISLGSSSGSHRV